MSKSPQDNVGLFLLNIVPHPNNDISMDFGNFVATLTYYSSLTFPNVLIRSLSDVTSVSYFVMSVKTTHESTS